MLCRMSRGKSGSGRRGHRCEGMAREDNLKARSPNEARKLGAKGGRASGEARRKKRDMRERLRVLLETKVNGVEGADALAMALYEKALAGDVKAFETLMATVGESPRQTVELPRLPKLQTAADLPKLTAAIIRAVARGELTLEEGQKLAVLAGAHMKALEAAELEQRISQLEILVTGEEK